MEFVFLSTGFRENNSLADNLWNSLLAMLHYLMQFVIAGTF